MTYKTEADLHTLLDGLTGGEHVKATLSIDNLTITAEGPVTIYETVVCDNKTIKTEGPVTINKMIWCDRPIRWENGDINPTLTSFEVVRDEEVTASCDDEKALHALLDSLEEVATITAEFGNGRGSTIMTGKVRTDGAFLEVYGYDTCVLRRHSGMLSAFLQSVTVRRTVVQRWEREGDG